MSGDNEAKARLDPVEILDNWGFNDRELKEITELIHKHQNMLLQKWDEFHPIR